MKRLGVDLDSPELLMEMEELRWSMKEFREKAADCAPTLVLIRMKNGTECGGIAGVPWPHGYEEAADAAEGSFIFSLGATPTRFDLVRPAKALVCRQMYFGFGPRNGGDLTVWGDGDGCGSRGQGAYAGPREEGQLIGGSTCYQPYERWELWRL
jgi:hypothetical protein